MRFRNSRVALLGALLLVGSACADPAPTRPNVLLVVFDTTRFDDWSIFSPQRAVTPVLDRVAARGQRFRDAHSLYSVTVPSHVSLFTGRAALALSEGESEGEGQQESDRAESAQASEAGYRRNSIFTILAANGYRTYAFSGNDNIAQGRIEALHAVDRTLQPRDDDRAEAYFQQVLARYGEQETLTGLRALLQQMERNRMRPIVVHNAAYVNEQALIAMRDHAEQHTRTPYLLFLNYNDAHDPYFPESPWDERFASARDSRFNGNLWSPRQRHGPPGPSALKLSQTSAGLSTADIERARALHLAELAYADARFGELLAELERLDLMASTIVVIAADHGEAFGEAGRMAHGGSGDDSVVEALMHVPLAMHFPDETIAPSVIEQRVDLRDVKPTLLDYLGIADDTSEGRSLLGLIRGTQQSLPPAAPLPQDIEPAAVGSNRIGGQEPGTAEQLDESLRQLGYIE